MGSPQRQRHLSLLEFQDDPRMEESVSRKIRELFFAARTVTSRVDELATSGVPVDDHGTNTRMDSLKRAEDSVPESHVERMRAELDYLHRQLVIHFELLMHSRTVKEKLIDAISKLQPFLTHEGRAKQNLLLRQVQWELNEEANLGIEKRFDELNKGLYHWLEKKCPDITKNEKRLCAYLTLNHGASEIAKITGRSLNSVNVGFARLRAKLGLPNNKDLRCYLKELRVSQG